MTPITKFSTGSKKTPKLGGGLLRPQNKKKKSVADMPNPMELKKADTKKAKSNKKTSKLHDGDKKTITKVDTDESTKMKRAKDKRYILQIYDPEQEKFIDTEHEAQNKTPKPAANKFIRVNQEIYGLGLSDKVDTVFRFASHDKKLHNKFYHYVGHREERDAPDDYKHARVERDAKGNVKRRFCRVSMSEAKTSWFGRSPGDAFAPACQNQDLRYITAEYEQKMAKQAEKRAKNKAKIESAKAAAKADN